MGDVLSKEEVLALVPQQAPFRFIDEIESSSTPITSWRATPSGPMLDFYRGHFPGNPITPGVILVETMAQAGVVAFGIYLYACSTELARGGAEAPHRLHRRERRVQRHR